MLHAIESKMTRLAKRKKYSVRILWIMVLMAGSDDDSILFAARCSNADIAMPCVTVLTTPGGAFFAFEG
jgi:hypothetical protein